MSSDADRLRRAIDGVLTTRPATRAELTRMFCRAIVEEFGMRLDPKYGVDVSYDTLEDLARAILEVAEADDD